MKTLNITFTDEEYKRLKKARDEDKMVFRSWHHYFLIKCAKGVSVKKQWKKKVRFT